MERRCGGIEISSFQLLLPLASLSLVWSVRLGNILRHNSIFYFQQEGLFHPLPSFIDLLQIMKALLLDFVSRWLSGFILCQALCSRHFTVLDMSGKPKSLKRAHTWEAHCQGPQTQQTLVWTACSTPPWGHLPASLTSSPWFHIHHQEVLKIIPILIRMQLAFAFFLIVFS